MVKDELFLGYQTNFPGTIEKGVMGLPAKIPVFHMLIAGQTQMSGKTTTGKTLIKQLVELGYKVLLFDTKTQLAEFDNFGEEVPLCLRETTDSLTILGLLESIMRRKLTMQYATLNKVCEGAKTFKDVLANAEDLMKESKSGFVQDAARILVDLMKRLIAQTENKNTTSSLELPYKINKMTINQFGLEAQQMIVKTAFEDALKIPKLVIFLDEANHFLPQKYTSACAVAIFSYTTQGAITKNFLWLSTQFLATTNKDTMKALDIRLLGRQSHVTECEHTIDYVPKLSLNLKIDANTVMQLKKGHFIVVAENNVKCVYVCPENADRKECQEVAMGRRSPEDIHYRFMFEAFATNEEIQEVKETVRRFGKRKDLLTEVIKIEPPPEEISQETKAEEIAKVENIKQTEVTWTSEKTPEKTPAPAPNNPEPEPELVRIELPPPPEEELDLDDVMAKQKEYLKQVFADGSKSFEDALAEISKRLDKVEQQKPEPIGIVPAETSIPTELNVSLTEQHTKIKVTPAIKEVAVSTENTKGKLLMLAKEGFFKTWHPLRDITASLEEHHWSPDYKEMKNTIGTLVDQQILTVKKAGNGENIYTLAPYVEFINGGN